MTNYPKIPISDICEITSSKRIFASDYRSSGIPFYRGKEISDSSLRTNAKLETYISQEKYQEISKQYGVPRKGDILLTSVGTLGNVMLVNNENPFYFKDGNLTWFRNFKDIDSKFLYYWLKSPTGKGELKKSEIGSSQRAYIIDKLKKMEIYLPDLPTQQKIASILSAYDDLIENNERRIKILEEMAQRLYTEWFVHFRYPGHESAPLVDSGTTYGMIPRKWTIQAVSAVVKRIQVGKRYDNNSIMKVGKIPVLDQGKSGIIGYHNDEPGVIASTNYPVIVFANHTCYQSLVSYPFSTIQNVLPFVPIDNHNIYWLHWATKDIITFHDYKGHWPEFVAKQIIFPSADITNLFGDKVSGCFREMSKLLNANSSAAKLREIILAQLLSGQKEVK